MKTFIISTIVGVIFTHVWSHAAEEHSQPADGVNQPPIFEAEWRFDVNWKGIKGISPIDDSESAKYLGKIVWISIAYQNTDGVIVGWKHRCGTITAYSENKGIQVDLYDSEVTASLPSAPNVLSPKPGGTFRSSEGRIIEDPDYLALWYCSTPKSSH